METARRADSVADAMRRVDSLATVRADTVRATYSTSDTVETAALDPGRSSIPTYLLSQHGTGRSFRTFSGKARLAYQGQGQNSDVTVVIRMRRDSAIWASVVAVGGAVPVARILLTPDSVLYVNFLQREAARMSARDAVGLLPIPLEFLQLQAVLLGEAQAPRAAVTSTGVSKVSSVYYIATAANATNFISYYNVADTTLIGEDVTAGDSLQVASEYKAFENVAGRKFPLERELSAAIGNSGSAAYHRFSLTFTDPPRFDIPLDFSFSIPRNYELK